MERQNYPIGEQSFKTLREMNQVYVDKTMFIPELLRNKYYFLSRPRRFGKSLFLSTLEQFFMGRRELFRGLAVDSFDWSWEDHPVLRISFGQGAFSCEGGLSERIDTIIAQTEERYGVKADGATHAVRLDNLIRKLHAKTGRGVVILVDEYEKPLLDTYMAPIFESNRRELSEFYSPFKDSGEHIRFLFITGVTRFGRLNIFSGLNNLLDISLEPQFSALCGITEQELRRDLAPGILSFAQAESCSESEAIDTLKKYYDGYHFSEDLLDIYNPWSLMNCLFARRVKAEWFATGSPSYLFKILRHKDYDIAEILGNEVTEEDLKGNGVDVMNPTALLYQSGYLTIKSYDRRSRLYTIGLPNFEVRTALWETLIPFYVGKSERIDRKDIGRLFHYLQGGDPEAMMRWLAAYFSKISFDTKVNFERDFQVLILGIFLLVKDFSDVHCEYAMSSGRTDLVVEEERFVYVFEFKMGDDPEKALEQINSRGYAVPWSADGRRVFKIGVSFSKRHGGQLRYTISQ